MSICTHLCVIMSCVCDCEEEMATMSASVGVYESEYVYGCEWEFDYRQWESEDVWMHTVYVIVCRHFTEEG
jgi:hypothetical protein